MKTKLWHILGLLILLAGAACAQPAPTQLAQQVVATAQVTTCFRTGTSLAGNAQQECVQAYVTNTPTPVPSPTATSSPTPTNSPTPTATPVVALMPWHAPGTHLDPITHLPYPVHEHGDPPPPEIAGAKCVPFSQHREGHVFYKGMLAYDKAGKGVLSYLIVHVASTTSATSHGDHDIMAFFVTPVTGVISCFEGVLDFGSPPQLITATADPQTRPIILSKNDGHLPYPDCETWYNRPGQFVFDLGWTVCNRWDRLDGTRAGGNGAHRGADWHVYVDRFSEWPGMDPGLAAFAVDDGFGHKRLDFVRNDVQYPADGVTGPN